MRVETGCGPAWTARGFNDDSSVVGLKSRVILTKVDMKGKNLMSKRKPLELKIRLLIIEITIRLG